MKRTPSGLFVASSFNFLRRYGRARGTERVVTDPRTGERMRVWWDDSRTTKQVEHDDTLDGYVRPKPIQLHLVARTPAARSEIAARVQAIRTSLRLRGPR